MTVSEVREVMRRMWARNAPLLSLIYAHTLRRGGCDGDAKTCGGSAAGFEQAYNMFFPAGK